MTLAVKFHNFIERNNVLEAPTEKISEYLTANKKMYKAALIANHIFRAAAMTAFMMFLPMTMAASACLCLGGSLFYRLTVETNCAYKFALPSFAGAVAFLIGKTALASLISGVAFASLSAFGAAFIAILPLCAYAAYIVLTVSYDVDQRG